MASYHAVLTSSAEKELKGLSSQLIARMVSRLESLASNPRPPGCKKLKGGDREWRIRVGDYRVYFERHELGLVVHRILSRHTLKDFLFRSGLKMQEDEALQQNPRFWEMIEAAKVATK